MLIVADDMGYGDFGVFGDGTPRTPTLDRLIDAGICLTQHYSASAVCAPARAALPPAGSRHLHCYAAGQTHAGAH